MKKITLALSLALATTVSAVSAQAAFKEFSLDGQSVTTYNERGYTLGIDMIKNAGEKIFVANLVLPEGSNFHSGPVASTYTFDRQPTVSLSDLAGATFVKKTEHAVSWEIDRLPESAVTVPKNSNLHEFMRRYDLNFNYINSDGQPRSTKIGLKGSAVTVAQLIKR